MDYFTEYLNSGVINNFELLTKERKKQLKKIQEIRGKNRDIMVYASDLMKGDAPISINYDDKLAFYDQIPKTKNKAIDIILETPGGFAEVVEDLLKNLRKKYDDIAVIVPGYAKSAGTIFAMGTDEILMGVTSALGPIDAQIINANGKHYSAGAFLQGLENIKIESKEKLELAYIPILQSISPGEIEHCKNSQDFSQILVREWLCKYKFKNWNIHKSSGEKVTEEEKMNRAEEIARDLADNHRWKTHAKSLDINDLRGLRLKITDFSENETLNDAIMRYYTLMRMSFEGGIYKIFETPDTQIYKMIPMKIAQQIPQDEVKNVVVDVDCPKCKEKHKVVCAFGEILEENRGCIPYPKNNILFCKKCHSKIDLSQLKNDVETQFNKKIVFSE